MRRRKRTPDRTYCEADQPPEAQIRNDLHAGVAVGESRFPSEFVQAYSQHEATKGGGHRDDECN